VLLVVAISAALWLAALVRLDPHRGAKGTAPRVAGFFVLGMLSVVPTYVLYELYPYGLVFLGLPLWDDFFLHVATVGPIEELAKFLVFLPLVTRFRTIREPVDGIYQAAAVGLGFAIVENVSYGLDYGVDVTLVRSLVTPLAHMSYAGIWGFVYASRTWGRRSLRARDRLAVVAGVLPGAFVHGLSNFLGNFGPALFAFDAVCATAALLVLRGLQDESPFAADDLRRPVRALGAIEASLVHDPGNPHLHLRAAYFRLRSGDAAGAERHLERYLAARPDDPYGLGLRGAARVLAGDGANGEQMLDRAEGSMRPAVRRRFRRNLRRAIAPGPGRRDGGFDESLLRTWLALSELQRERVDSRRVPPRVVPRG
jgi:RsiW-degrading membrane proteinase PrsW (M82 family)